MTPQTTTKPDSPLLKGLNDRQRKAVTQGDGPLLIVAGAGTGKTTVITKRIAWLLEQKKAEPEEILALTFTEKAAAEMEGRVAEELPLGRVPQHISTFHSFGDRLLRDFSLEVGLPPTFSVIRDLEQTLLLKEHLYDLPLDFFRPRYRPGVHLKMLAKFFSRAKQDDISADEYAIRVQHEAERVSAMGESPERDFDAASLAKSQEVAECFKRYEELKASRYAIDQTDQVFMAYRLLRDNKVVRGQIKDRFKYVLVDEYQDVDIVQAKLVDLLAGESGNITVVGDDDQSIYGFRGASVSNILNFPKTHKAGEPVVLTTNYRSSQPVLDLSYKLIRHNDPYRLEHAQKIDKRLTAHDGDGPAPLYSRYPTVHDEAEAVATRVEDLLRDPDLSPSDIAILSRTRDLGDYFQASLRRHGIPVAVDTSDKLYDTHEVRVCLAFLDLTVNPRQSDRLRLLATSELYGMPHDDVAKLGKLRRERQEELWDLLDEVTEEHFSAAAVKASGKLKEEIRKFCQLADTLNAGQLLYRWLSEHTDWVRREELTADDALRTQNLSKFFKRIRTFVENASDPSVGAWKDYFDDVLAYGDDPAASEMEFDREAVRVITLHAAKGLEFDTVFMVGLAQDMFPGSKWSEQIPSNLLESARLPENDNLREERRLCYVGMTRAKRRLVLTCAETYDGVKTYKPSQFMREATGQDAPAAAGGTAPDPLVGGAPEQPDTPLAAVWSPPDPLELSYSQINAYDECPLKFYWEHIENVYVETDPTTEYGNLLHSLIAMINTAHMRGEAYDEAQLTALFDDAWKTRRWIYDSARQRDDAKRKGLKAILGYAAAEAKRPAAFAVEEKFVITVAGVIVNGRIDRIDKQGDEYSIVDYKSSEVRTQRQADYRLNTNKQLTLYAMSIKDRFGKYPASMSLHFIESGRVASMKASKPKLNNMTKKVEEVADGLRRRDFTPNRAQHYCTPTIFNHCPGNTLPPVREV